MNMDIFLEKGRIVLGRENMNRKAIPQTNRRREESSPEFYRATESRGDNIGMSLGRLTRDTNRIVELRYNT